MSGTRARREPLARRLRSSISAPLSLPVSPRLMGGPEPSTSPRSWSTPRDCEQPHAKTHSFPFLSVCILFFSFALFAALFRVTLPSPTLPPLHPAARRGSDSQLRRCPVPLNKCSGLVLALRPPRETFSLTHFSPSQKKVKTSSFTL